MRLHTLSHFIARSCLLAGAATPLAFASAVEYDVTVNTTSIATTSGYIDMQFNPSGTPGDQSATASVSTFVTDSIFESSAANGPNGNVTGSLGPTSTLTFQNGPSSPNEYTQAVTFGTTISFDLTLDGPMIEGPNGQGEARHSVCFWRMETAMTFFPTIRAALPGS